MSPWHTPRSWHCASPSSSWYAIQRCSVQEDGGGGGQAGRGRQGQARPGCEVGVKISPHSSRHPRPSAHQRQHRHQQDQHRRRPPPPPSPPPPHLFDEREEGPRGDALRQVGVQVLPHQQHGAVAVVDALHRPGVGVGQARQAGTHAQQALLVGAHIHRRRSSRRCSSRVGRSARRGRGALGVDLRWSGQRGGAVSWVRSGGQAAGRLDSMKLCSGTRRWRAAGGRAGWQCPP